MDDISMRRLHLFIKAAYQIGSNEGDCQHALRNAY